MRLRQGFTLLELFVVLVIAGITAAIAVPSLSNSLASSNLQRAASVIVADLQYAHSVAARQRAPVQIVVSATDRTLTVRNVATTHVYARRFFGATSTTVSSSKSIERGGEYPVQSMSTTATSIVVFPSGLTSGPITITVTASGKTRSINMTRSGQVRVSAT